MVEIEFNEKDLDPPKYRKDSFISPFVSNINYQNLEINEDDIVTDENSIRKQGIIYKIINNSENRMKEDKQFSKTLKRIIKIIILGISIIIIILLIIAFIFLKIVKKNRMKKKK